MGSSTAGSRIREFYGNKSVFLTGVTGFLGKVILLKLLKSCPEISNVYVLIREKKEATAAERLQSDVLNAEPFEEFFGQWPSARDKVIAVNGNITEPNLGMNSNDFERLCNEVAVVIHAAASVRFNEPIQEAMKTNFQGVCNMLHVATKIKNLEAFVQISSAYSNTTRNRTVILEEVYPPSVTPQEATESLQSMTEEEASAITSKLLEGRPNTYTFAKNLAEQLVQSYRRDLPVCIVRPSTISAAQKEPFPGWVDSWVGVTGTMAFMFHGFQRFLLLGSNQTKLDFTPVDHVVNIAITAAWFTATASNTGKEPPLIYNCCSSGSDLGSLPKLIGFSKEALWETPFSRAFRYPSVTYVTNQWVFRFCDAIFHRLPCQLMDLKAKLFSQKPLMMKTYDRMSKVFQVVNFFSLYEFDFSTENTKKLHEELNQVDKALFNFDKNSIQWEPYMHNYVAGIRKCLLRDSDDRLEMDRTRYKRLYMIHCISRGLMIFLIAAIFVAFLIWILLPLIERNYLE